MENNSEEMRSVEVWFNQEKFIKHTAVKLEAGKCYKFRLEFVKSSQMDFSLIQLLYLPPVDPDSVVRAAKLASTCDVAVVFAGMPTGFESEGRDPPIWICPARKPSWFER